ncbi:MAG: NAD(P)-dependent oxidoreductase [Muribaculaceae bacterium]|nr:NAD(P)-dependent oxidoreductase [Muribaculaceae bacterium]
MKNQKIRVFMTGATGVMGAAGLKELCLKPENYQVSVLARPSKKNQKMLKSFQEKGVDVVWGDLLDPVSLRRGIEEADIVLHVGGMVSPMADHFPEKTMNVNVGSAKLISDIIKEIETLQPSREIKMVYIGSVSQYGTHMPPDHWGNSQTPENPAKNDAYAISKMRAEEAVRNAGLKKWVSIRQTSILHAGLLKNASNPVAFHTPLQGVLEWITTEDSGRLLERICSPEVPDSFWGRAYNAGGGKSFRLINLDFERKILEAMGCPPPEKIFEPNWFATHNFHGMWFEDSDLLDNILHFRRPDSFDLALGRLKKSLPFYLRLAPLAPAFIIKKFMRHVASHPSLGPLSWIKNNDLEKIETFWGSREAYDNIPDWENFKEIKLSTTTPANEKNR